MSRHLFVPIRRSPELPTGAWSRACLQALLARTAFFLRMILEMMLQIGCHGVGLKSKTAARHFFDIEGFDREILVFNWQYFHGWTLG